MQTALPHPVGQVRQLAPFVLLSLLLHVALLFFIRPPAPNFSVAQQHPMEVYFSALPVSGQTPAPIKAHTEKRGSPARLPASPKLQSAPLAAQPDATSHSDNSETSRVFNLQPLMESAKNMARDEARKTEHHTTALEKERLNTPAGLLGQYLRQPHKEIRLANGMLKIITDAGAVCFQPVPYFARDSAGLFGIPTSCP
ncbi:MAG: hypothetical protein A2V79_00450 [Betaproteobacteria bacterium RBG_16_56_24]|nr:MAG: hypothetical protein A2V79_00450 [Betaproteobacteria bacterium RBG_16_56_24]